MKEDKGGGSSWPPSSALRGAVGSCSPSDSFSYQFCAAVRPTWCWCLSFAKEGLASDHTPLQPSSHSALIEGLSLFHVFLGWEALPVLPRKPAPEALEQHSPIFRHSSCCLCPCQDFNIRETGMFALWANLLFKDVRYYNKIAQRCIAITFHISSCY